MLELCAGAGHIGLAAAVLADRDLIQVEVDAVAAGYARANAAHADWSARTDVRNTRLEQALQPNERFPLIVADPPYLRSVDISLWPEDPSVAIDGGVDGLDVIHACLHLAGQHLTDRGQLLLQIAGPRQDREITRSLEARPAWGLVRHAVRVIDDDRAILLLGRSPRDSGV